MRIIHWPATTASCEVEALHGTAGADLVCNLTGSPCRWSGVLTCGSQANGTPCCEQRPFRKTAVLISVLQKLRADRERAGLRKCACALEIEAAIAIQVDMQCTIEITPLCPIVSQSSTIQDDRALTAIVQRQRLDNGRILFASLLEFVVPAFAFVSLTRSQSFGGPSNARQLVIPVVVHHPEDLVYSLLRRVLVRGQLDHLTRHLPRPGFSGCG